MIPLLGQAARLCNATLFFALAVPCSTQVWSQSLPPAYFQVLVDGQLATGSYDQEFFENYDGIPLNTGLDLTGVTQHGFFSQSVVEASTTGGRRPMADVQGSAIFARAGGGATVSYAFRAAPVNPAVVAPGPIPVFMQAAGSVSVSGGANVSGGARASFRIDEAADAFRDPRLQNSGAGFRGVEIRVSVEQGESSAAAEFAETFRLGLSSGDHGIRLLAAGSGRAASPTDRGDTLEFQSVIDPIFWVDPVATFDGPGGPLRYADAYRIELSEGILPAAAIPEPSTVLLFAAGLVLVGLRSGRLTQRIRNHRARRYPAPRRAYSNFGLGTLA